VSWLSDGNGLFFGNPGSIVSVNLLKNKPSQGTEGFSLAIALEPSWVSEGVILSFYRPATRVTSLVLRQLGEGLVLEHQTQGSSMKLDKYIGSVFTGIKSIRLTIASGNEGISIYVDGNLKAKLTDLTISNRDIEGKLLIGNAPSMSSTWSGRLKAVSIYSRELSAAQVMAEFTQSIEGGKVDSAWEEAVVARYCFNEGLGNVVHNQVDSGTDLMIPDRFFILNKKVLERPWTEYHPPWSSYCWDLGVNILGFIPLGLFFCAYFSHTQIEHATLVTVAFGFVLSLIIELVQAFLPTRASGMTDIITNTLGTALGALAFRHKLIHTVLPRAMIRASSLGRPSVTMWPNHL
jgi:VanZ family protein